MKFIKHNSQSIVFWLVIAASILSFNPFTLSVALLVSASLCAYKNYLDYKKEEKTISDTNELESVKAQCKEIRDDMAKIRLASGINALRGK